LLLDEFGRQLKAELGKLSGDSDRMRTRKIELETELSRYAEAVAVGGNMPAIVAAMKARQDELDAITGKLLSMRPDSIEGRFADIRRFVTKRIMDLREVLAKDVVLAKTELLKHVQEIRMIPRRDQSGAHYEATGEWSLLGDDVQPGPGTRPSNSVGCGGLQCSEDAGAAI
jgi:hypothetical protein